MSEVIAKVRRAHGSQNIGKLQNSRWLGTTNFVHQGLKGSYSILIGNSGQFYSRADLGEFGWIEIAISGNQGWMDSSYQPKQELLADQIRSIQSLHPQVIYGDWTEEFESVEILDMETKNDLEVYTVKLVNEGIPDRTVYVSTETGLIVRLDTKELAPGIGNIPVTVRYEDYRAVGGFKMPYRVISQNAFNGRWITTFDTVEANVDLPENAFTPISSR